MLEGYAVPLAGRSLSQGYGRTKIVLRDVTFRLELGVTALLGENGAGKTTLLRTLIGQLKPKHGHVVLGDIDIYSRQGKQVRSVRIGYLPQRVTFDPRLTVAEFISYIAWLRGFPRARISEDLRGVLQTLGLQSIAKYRMGALSGGQVQRAGIGAAIVGKPDVLVLDEPTVGLDPIQRLDLRKLIGEGLAPATLLSTHMIDDVTHLNPRVIALVAGKVAYDGGLCGLEARAPEELEGMSRAEAGFAALVRDTGP